MHNAVLFDLQVVGHCSTVTISDWSDFGESLVYIKEQDWVGG